MRCIALVSEVPKYYTYTMGAGRILPKFISNKGTLSNQLFLDPFLTHEVLAFLRDLITLAKSSLLQTNTSNETHSRVKC